MGIMSREIESDVIDIWKSAMINLIGDKSPFLESSEYLGGSCSPRKLPKNEMVQYIRDNKRNKRGVMVAFKILDKVFIGWSLCSKQDTFDREFGIEIAKNRALKLHRYEHVGEKIPYSIYDDMEMFVDRCARYFKDSKYPKWIGYNG